MVKTKKGGVVTKKRGDILEMFKTVMKNSTFEYFNSGANGYIFVVTFQGEDSGFVDLQHKRIVKNFIIKIIPFDITLRWTGQDKIVTPSDQTEFDKEIAIQTHLYKTSLKNFFTAICPAILGSFKLLVQDLPTLFPQTFLDGLRFLHQGKPDNGFNKTLGILFMESFAPCKSLYSTSMLNETVWLQPFVQEKIKKARRLLFMAYECGVSHADYHLGNILDVEPMMLIDFGRSKLVSPEDRTVFIQQLKLSDVKKDYTIPILILIDDISPSLQDHRLYQWLRRPEYPNTLLYGIRNIEVAPQEVFVPIHFSKKDHAECVAGECTPSVQELSSSIADEVIKTALKKTKKGGFRKKLKR